MAEEKNRLNSEDEKNTEGFRILNSDPEGNKGFCVVRGEDGCDMVNTVSIRREGFGEVARLLGIPDGVNSYMDNLEKPDDPRKFMIFYNPLYSRPYPAVIILKYMLEGNDRMLVDVDDGDADFVEFVKNDFLRANKRYRTIRLTVKPELNADEADLLRAMGTLCNEGFLFEKDYDSARTMYEIAARAGDAEAMNDLAKMYNVGHGVTRDIAVAKELYAAAAKAGSTNALIDMGKEYLYAGFGKVDPDNAILCFQKALDMGSEEAGVCLEKAKEMKDPGSCGGWYHPYLTCEVYIRDAAKDIMSLDAGMCAVADFSNHADNIPGAISVDRDWGCNVDVAIKGDDLLEFIKGRYPKVFDAAVEKIDPEKTYTIVCYDMS